jgi:AraC-like DNA-binding protein
MIYGDGCFVHPLTMATISDTGFQETATLPSSQARLYSWGATWGARALYLGPALGLSPHRNAVAVLALGLDDAFAVANNPGDPLAGYRRCRSALIPPNTLHHVTDTVGLMGFLYVDACSRDFDRLKSLVQDKTARAGFDLTLEEALIALLRDLASGVSSWQEVKAELNRHLAGASAIALDPRVRLALDALHTNISRRPTLKALANRVGLSESRLRRLFKSATGVPLRRYRIWIAMGAAMRAIARGRTLTTAAMDAGFSSSAHFSAAYREMFGMEPSRLVKGRLTALREKMLV